MIMMNMLSLKFFYGIENPKYAPLLGMVNYLYNFAMKGGILLCLDHFYFKFQSRKQCLPLKFGRWITDPVSERAAEKKN